MWSCGDRPHLLRRKQFLDLADSRAAERLDADLDDAIGALQRGAHPFGVVRVEGHRLFLEYTSLPAWMAGTKFSACTCCGVAISTASMLLSSSNRRKS